MGIKTTKDGLIIIRISTGFPFYGDPSKFIKFRDTKKMSTAWEISLISNKWENPQKMKLF